MKAQYDNQTSLFEAKMNFSNKSDVKGSVK